MTTYTDFLQSKMHSNIKYGIGVNYTPDAMFDYQKYVLKYAVEKGRAAVFLDTGLGKTIIEIATAINYHNETQKPVLIITPLAVAFQFIEEAKKFGISDIEYSKDGKYTSSIVVCNYERLSKFNYSDFDCVILDESSILKNFKGVIKGQITKFLRKVKYRFLFTATPSPNDFIELGTSSEALGYLGYTDMLTKFFTNNEDTISPQHIGTKWLLKGHAKQDFFKWVSSWSISMRKPSDLGFDDTKHILPELIINEVPVKNPNNMVVNGQILMFNMIAKTMSEIKAEQRVTIKERCEKAVELSTGKNVSVYWVNFNKESELINQMDPNVFEIKGSMKLEHKEDILMDFSKGKIKKLVTKPTITAFGLNWQHCNHTIYFPTFSYEQYYQAIRRFWRFGQKNPVHVDLVYSDGMKRIIQSLIAKADKANELFNRLNQNINSKYNIKETVFNNQVEIPSFLKK